MKKNIFWIVLVNILIHSNFVNAGNWTYNSGTLKWEKDVMPTVLKFSSTNTASIRTWVNPVLGGANPNPTITNATGQDLTNGYFAVTGGQVLAADVTDPTNVRKAFTIADTSLIAPSTLRFAQNTALVTDDKAGKYLGFVNLNWYIPSIYDYTNYTIGFSCRVNNPSTYTLQLLVYNSSGIQLGTTQNLYTKGWNNSTFTQASTQSGDRPFRFKMSIPNTSGLFAYFETPVMKLISSSEPTVRTITVNSVGAGSVANTYATVRDQDNQIFTITPTTGQTLISTKFNGSTVTPINNGNGTYTYITPLLTANGVLNVEFSAVQVPITSGTISSKGYSETELAQSHFTISSGELIIDQNVNVHSLTVAPGAKLTLSSGSLAASNGITLQSSSVGTATFVDNNNSSPQAVAATVEQYLGSTSARNYYITPPVAGAAVPSGQTYYSYDESGTNTGFVNPATLYWKAETQGSTLDPRKGYIAQTTGVTKLSFTGTLNTGIQTPLTLTRTSLAAKPGFNLVANPYPSYLDWKLVSAANTGLSTTAWFRTKDNSGGYIFATVNVANPLNPVIVAVDPNTTITTLIPPMQAYWVLVSTVGSTTYAVNNTMRTHADNTSNKFKSPSLGSQSLIRLRVSNGSNADETVVLFNANATNGIDMFDSPKMSNNSTSVPEIFTQIDTEKLVINGMKDLKYDTEIPIGFSTLIANDFTISAYEISNFETGTRVILLDKLNPTVETELSNGAAYNFSATVTTANTDRFSVIFRAPKTTTGLKTTDKLNAHVFVNSENMITIIAPEKCNYRIYNSNGCKVACGLTTKNYNTLNHKLITGQYVVLISNNAKELTTKVVIK